MNNFVDITDEIYNPTENLSLGELIYTPGFTLLDAMSAIHIGDNRMDSYLNKSIDSFNPITKLNLLEITYIIDKTSLLELEFYKGSHLIQSLYSSLYLHKLSSIQFHLLEFQSLNLDDDKNRYEWQWIGLVLRSSLLATLKCANFAWFELIKGVMYDIEDFNSDKAGLSLGEMYNDQDVEILLIESLNWINHKLESDSNNDIIIGLRDRIQLRLNLFSIYNPYLTNCPSDNPRQLDESLSSINHAIELIKIISPSPSPSTKVSNSFYSGISKYLPNMAPLPPLDDALLDIQGKNVWEGFKPSLECFRDINKAIRVQDPLEWINWLSSRSISKPSERALPSYLRNLTLSRFISDDNLIFNQHSIEWITDSLLQGMIGLPHGVLDLVIRLKQAEMTVVGRNPMSIGQALSVWSQRVAGFYVNLVSTYCHNRPRQKRNLPKSIKQFEELDNEIETVHQPSTKSLQPLSPTLATLFALIPFAMRSFILSLNIESLLVTTELDLLDKEHDWFIIYWQLSRVARSWQYELNQASSSLSSLPVDNRVGFTEAVKHNALEWMKERTLFASIMDHLSQATLNASALHIIKLNTPSLSTGERQARFQRRLKWTMRGNIPRDTHSVRDIETDPSFELYDKDLFVLNGNATTEAATRYYESALEKINLSLSINTSQAHLKLSEEKRDSTLQALKLICETNIDKVKNTSSTQQHTLQWSNALQPWFPNLASSIN